MDDNPAVLFLQKRYRGIRDRRFVHTLRNDRADSPILRKAAIAIQRAFRCWRAYMSRSHRSVFDIPSAHSKAPRKDESKVQYWHRIKTGRGTFQDKVILWRNIIDIRRDNPKASSELCLHAIFKADGSLSKAQIFLLSTDFIADHELKRLTPEQQDFFMPCTFTGTRKTNNKAMRNLYSSLNEANTLSSPHHIGLRKSFYYRRQGNRNPTPDYLRQYESIRKQSQLDPIATPSLRSLSTSPPKRIQSAAGANRRKGMNSGESRRMPQVSSNAQHASSDVTAPASDNFDAKVPQVQSEGDVIEGVGSGPISDQNSVFSFVNDIFLGP